MRHRRNLNVFSAITWPLTLIAGGLLRYLIDKHLDRSTRIHPR